MKMKILVSAFAIVTAGAACAELPAIDANQCGNRVVDATEDCDTFAASGSSCRAPGTDGACRFDCSGSNVCPNGYSCGAVDQICRRPSGAFDVANSQSIFAEATGIAFADFDGDGRQDAITSGANDLRIHYFDDHFVLGKTLPLQIPSARFRVGPIGDDTNADLELIRTNGAVDVFRGISDRTLAPVIYSSVPIPSTTTIARAILVRNQLTNTTGDSLARPTGADILAFGSGDKGVGAVVDVAGRGSGQSLALASVVVALPDSTVDKVAGNIAVGSFIEGSVCDQFAIGFSGDARVSVYTPCRHTTPIGNGNTYVQNTVVDSANRPDPAYVSPTRVSLGGLATVGISFGGISASTFVFDVNGDGHQDLVIAATSIAKEPQIYVAYGIGDGTFSSSPTLTPVDEIASNYTTSNAAFASGDGTASAAATSRVPLAIGDLNADGLMDFVFPNIILFSEKGALPAQDHYVGGPNANGQPWTGAVLADFNHDGVADVAAANSNGAIDFFLGTGTASMSYLSYGLDGTPSNLVVGDFDGDRVNDLGFISSGVTGDDGGAAQNEVEVLFGQATTFPEQPTLLGALSSVVQLASAPLSATYTGAPSSTNAFVSSMTAFTIDSSSHVFAAILVGNPDRLVTSPFALYISGSQRASASRLISGPIATANENDLAFLGQDLSDAKDLDKFAMWFAPSTGDAQVDSTKLQSGPQLPETYDWSRANLADANLDGSGVATELLLVPPIAQAGAPPGPPKLFVVDPTALTIDAGISLPCTLATSPATVTAQVRVTDFDGDGFKDVLALCPDVSGKTILTIYWGNGTKSLDPARSTNVPVPAEPVTAYTFYRSAPVIERSVAILTANGFYYAAPSGADHRTFATVTKDPTLPGGSSLNGGDIDGDGVLDFGIVDVTKTKVQFFRGIPVNDTASAP